MELQYLLFDASDEAWGAGSFDAMASVAPAHVAGLVAEVQAVLRWAHGAFGPPGAGDQGVWDYALHASDKAGRPWPMAFDAEREAVEYEPLDEPDRVTLTLTLSGSQAFCDAFADAFSEAA